MAYTCKSCGAVADAPGHLCNPCGDKAKCSFCGEPATEPTHVCKDKLAAMKFVCGGCGRVALIPTHKRRQSSLTPFFVECHSSGPAVNDHGLAPLSLFTMLLIRSLISRILKP
jgi:hypothetical protein